LNDSAKRERFFQYLLLTIIFCPNEKKGPITRSKGKGDLFVPPQSGNRGTKADISAFNDARNFLLREEIVGWRLELEETALIGETENESFIAESFPFEVNNVYNFQITLRFRKNPKKNNESKTPQFR
jgi:hypothetical protein